MNVELDYKKVIGIKIQQYLNSLAGIYFNGPFTKESEKLIIEIEALHSKKRKTAEDILAHVEASKNEQEALAIINLALSNKTQMKPEVGDHDLLHCLQQCKDILTISREENSDNKSNKIR